MARSLKLMLAVLVVMGVCAAAYAEGGQSKTGKVKSVDATAKTFTLSLDARPLTFSVNDKTTYTLDGKASTFEDAVKVDAKITVTYSKEGENRVASKVEATSAEKKESR